MKPGANPIPVFAAMIEDVRNMRANGSDIEDEVVCLLFLRALPEEYSVFRQMLERERKEAHHRPAPDRIACALRPSKRGKGVKVQVVRERLPHV